MRALSTYVPLLFGWRTRLGDCRVFDDGQEKAASWLYLAPLKTSLLRALKLTNFEVRKIPAQQTP
jgi:hypothetical protein